MRSSLLTAALVVASASPTAAQRSVLAFQGFENNSQATTIEESGANAPGVLTEGQQALELVATGESLANGNPVFEFVQPTSSFDPLNPETPRPAVSSGRVFDAGGSSLPWTLKWANSRVTDAGIAAAAAGAEAAEELRLFTLLGFFVDLNYTPTVFAADITGPVVPEVYDLGTGIFSVTQSTFVPLPAVNGVGGDSNDSLGVNDDVLLTEFDGAASEVPEGELAFFAIDGDGLLELEFDPVDTDGFGALQLSFELAAGGNSNTFYGDFDRFAVEVNGVEMFNLEGDSGLGTVPDPASGAVDELDVFADGSFQAFDLDLTQFDGQEVQVSFFFDNNNDGGNNFDAFALDAIELTGIAGFVPLDGDYNGDGVVNAADYTVWRDTETQSVTPGSGADGNGDGVIDGADYAVWTANYGAQSATANAVPEPATALMLSVVVLVVRRRFTT